ncbi:hypothetical protein BDP27DRAFT_724648 [Rhodocollybia butyracea]|uniref:Uncharacterized protein n=1 Tax=Rhodocollybia butyracea TaxID=206335 RepID=A0A9P5P2K4_9AGAR|nr:hypothetical protein BDP27DRAFT_724648 [Rhodocollybia butyracea]
MASNLVCSHSLALSWSNLWANITVGLTMDRAKLLPSSISNINLYLEKFRMLEMWIQTSSTLVCSQNTTAHLRCLFALQSLRPCDPNHLPQFADHPFNTLHRNLATLLAFLEFVSIEIVELVSDFLQIRITGNTNLRSSPNDHSWYSRSNRISRCDREGSWSPISWPMTSQNNILAS